MDENVEGTGKAFSIYASLLNLYPKRYRREYKAQMLLIAEDMLADATDKLERQAIWLRLFLDLPGNLYREHYNAVGSIMNTENERQFRYMSYLSMMLIIMSFIIISGVHTEEQVGFIHRNIGPIILIIAIGLPFIAAALAWTALQQISHHITGQLTLMQRHHRLVLISVLITSITALLLALASLIFLPQYTRL